MTARRRHPSGKSGPETSGPLSAVPAAFLAPLFAPLLAGALLLAGCAAAPDRAPVSSAPSVPSYAAHVKVSAGPERLSCVPYARDLSQINIRGDAWTWWDGARAASYERGPTPEPGAVLVLKRQGKSLGHLAVVTRVIDGRTVLASHANWLNGGRIYENTPVRDVSRAGDWSAVRVWYPPGNVWGRSVYAAYGFVYGPKTNRGQVAASE